MITLFTAVGKYELEYQEDGSRVPVIYAGGKKHSLCIEEFILWSALIWKISTRDEVETAYYKREANAHIFSDSMFEHHLHRMTKRGLIVSGTDYTGIDALYSLMKNLFICPMKTPFATKIKAFFVLTFKKGIEFNITKNIFKSDKLTNDESMMLCLAKQSLLSTAELIKCIESGITNIENDSELIDILYDDFSDGKDLSIEGRFSKERIPMLEALCNLYLKKLIILETTI